MTIREFKGRKVEKNQRVNCFWNLHEAIFSIEGRTFERGRSRKLILSHGNDLLLENVTFSVNERLRQQVLREKQKNIHAFVKGELVSAGEKKDVSNLRQAYYNPYKVDSFVDSETGEKLDKVKYAVLRDKKVYYMPW